MPFWNRKTDTLRLPSTLLRTSGSGQARLLVGLGNPGEKYAGNRHNIGFMCLDYYAQWHRVAFAKSRRQARISAARIGQYEVVLAKPQTFMNNSGQAVGRLVRQYKVKVENLVVIHDDLDLPVGRIRIRLGGSSGGHKGINSIVEHISDQGFVRVRVGIGRPNGAGEDDIINYVLGDFMPDEKAIIEDVIPLVGEALDSLLTEGLTVTMNRFNGIDLKKSKG